MTSIEIVPATLEHIQTMGETMNHEDRLEFLAAGLIPHRDLWKGWKRSIIRRSAIVDGELAAIWGVMGSLMGDVGTVWLITSPKARETSPHKFAAIYKEEVRKMLEIYPVLCNMVDDRYIGAKRMLRIAGFKMDEPQPIGKFNRMFRKFTRIAQ
jgi:hypothetical protein